MGRIHWKSIHKKTKKDIMSRFTKQLVLMLLFLVVINAAPQRRQRNARSLDQRMGDLLLETRAPQRKFTDSLKGRSLDQRMGDLQPQTRIVPLVAGLIWQHIWQ